MKHTGPYTITFISKRGREYKHVRKTFKAAENIASSYFSVDRMQSIQITNAEGAVWSRFNYTAPGA